MPAHYGIYRNPAFYAAHAFRPLSADGRRLFIPMGEVAKLFA